MDKEDLVEIWGDVVSIRGLFIAIIISSLSSMAGYFLAPADPSRKLLFGLLGGLLGFLVSTLINKPKRTIIKEGEDI